MSQEKIEYKRPVEEKTGGVYSCDKVQLVYRLRFGEGQELLDQMARQGWFEYDHWESRKFGTYRNQFSVKCGADGKLSCWLGVGMVAYGKSRPSDTAKLEFNPNKVGGERSLLWLLRQLWSRAKQREGCEVKQWDLACDWPEPREWYSLRKDARLYEEVMRSKADRTQYLGERNKPGRCKLYNKQVESGLTSPLTRLEITVEGLAGPHQVAALWPTVYRMADVQGDAEIAALNDTDRFIFATLLDAPDRLNELGRRKRARFAGLLEKCRYRVEFDPQAYKRVLADVAQYAQAPDPHDPKNSAGVPSGQVAVTVVGAGRAAVRIRGPHRLAQAQNAAGRVEGYCALCGVLPAGRLRAQGGDGQPTQRAQGVRRGRVSPYRLP